MPVSLVFGISAGQLDGRLLKIWAEASPRLLVNSTCVVSIDYALEPLNRGHVVRHSFKCSVLVYHSVTGKIDAHFLELNTQVIAALFVTVFQTLEAN